MEPEILGLLDGRLTTLVTTDSIKLKKDMTAFSATRLS